MLPIIINILLAIHILASVLLVLVVLMQRPKSEGLGAAFGGGMTENLFGAQTTTVLTKFTVYLGIAFFVLTLTLAVLYSVQSRVQTGLQQELAKPVAAEGSEPPLPGSEGGALITREADEVAGGPVPPATPEDADIAEIPLTLETMDAAPGATAAPDDAIESFGDPALSGPADGGAEDAPDGTDAAPSPPADGATPSPAPAAP